MTLQTENFKDAIDRFALELATIERHRLVKRLAQEVLRKTVARTPVRTGLLKSNWQIKFSDPDSAEKTEVRSNPIGDEESKLRALHLHRVVYIVNPVHYAVYVEYGTDRIAPRLMLTRSLEEVYGGIR